MFVVELSGHDSDQLQIENYKKEVPKKQSM